jgi:hypothetical protein
VAVLALSVASLADITAARSFSISGSVSANLVAKASRFVAAVAAVN